MPSLTITFDTDDGGEEEVSLPAKWEVCDNCHGEGKHVNRAIDGNGLNPNDPDLDDEFWETYRSGGYDVTCDECKGRTTVLVVDDDALSEDMKDRYHKYQSELAAYEAERRAELRFGY